MNDGGAAIWSKGLLAYGILKFLNEANQPIHIGDIVLVYDAMARGKDMTMRVKTSVDQEVFIFFVPEKKNLKRTHL